MESDVAAIFAQPPERDGYLYVPGIISEKCLHTLIATLRRRPQRFLLALADPIKLLVAANPVGYYELLGELEKTGAVVGVLRRVPLFAVTINPFYPDYRMEAKAYAPAFVDVTRLQLAVKGAVKIPVYNVVKQGAKGLVDIILANARRWEHPDTVRF